MSLLLSLCQSVPMLSVATKNNPLKFSLEKELEFIKKKAT